MWLLIKIFLGWIIIIKYTIPIFLHELENRATRFLLILMMFYFKFRLGNWMAIQRTLKKVTVELEYYVQHYRGVVHQIKQRIIHERAQIWNFSSSISFDNSCTSERSERVRCQVEHEKRNSISTSNYVLFCLSYKHSSPSLTRNVESING